MHPNRVALKGRVVEGHKVASRPSAVYPYGTIEKQKPIFKKLGLDLDSIFDGTLNISIAPCVFKMSRPGYTFEKVEWTDLHPPETFSFSRCQLKFRRKAYAAWVYYPHPETKARHYQAPSVIEVLAPFILEMQYGADVEVWINPGEITVEGLSH
jgi:hypothetical protein